MHPEKMESVSSIVLPCFRAFRVLKISAPFLKVASVDCMNARRALVSEP